QRGQRVIDQRLVVDRQQLLRGCKRKRIKPRALASRQNDTFAFHALSSAVMERSRYHAEFGSSKRFTGPRPVNPVSRPCHAAVPCRISLIYPVVTTGYGTARSHCVGRAAAIGIARTWFEQFL